MDFTVDSAVDSIGASGRGWELASLDIDAELARFEAEERARLGLGEERSERAQWRDDNPQEFWASQRAHTTILVGGLTLAQDHLLMAGLQGAGYRVKNLDVPTNDALRVGKEYGNRGQCNPTYFTVGNLVKYLLDLEAQGKSKKEIVDTHVFMTAGACGPCRFGTYATEYRKALRDAGFDGFRVILFQQQGGMKQATGEELGLRFDLTFFRIVFQAIVIGDVINAIGYRMRPYELEVGATDRALEECKRIIGNALAGESSVMLSFLRARRILSAVAVDKLRTKPKVAQIGEFWAMTTEGDGNYRMQRFLEREGAEVDVQLTTAWLLYMLWENSYDTKQRMNLRGVDSLSKGLAEVDVARKLAYLTMGEIVVRGYFQLVANLVGLHGYHLPDMDEVAEVSHAFYNNELRGGEGHMEVGKLILNVFHSKVNMTLSIKPFGCMPSSGVSDGVQSAITELFPDAIFLPIETSGDGEVNVQSRVQMMLFKAKQRAEREVAEALGRHGMTMEEVRAFALRMPLLRHGLLPLPHHHGSTAADMVELVGRIKHPLKTAQGWLKELRSGTHGSAVAIVRDKLSARRAAAEAERRAAKEPGAASAA